MYLEQTIIIHLSSNIGGSTSNLGHVLEMEEIMKYRVSLITCRWAFALYGHGVFSWAAGDYWLNEA